MVLFFSTEMKQNIDEILEALDSKEDIPHEHKASHIEKIRRHLKSQLNDIKEIERRLRTTGKNMCYVSRSKRAMTASSNSNQKNE